MGGIVKSITGAISGKRSAKKAYQAQLRGLQGAVDEQRSIYDDISTSQTNLRDTNIADIEGLAGRASGEYDDLFTQLEGILQQQYDDVSGLQQGAFQSNEERLLANLDDVLNRSQQSFDYAQENLMPYIKQGQEAFNQYTQKAMEGFNYQPFEEEFQSPEPFQYDDFQAGPAFEYEDFKPSQAPFQYDDFQFDYESSPGYQFALDSALNAATNTAAAQGMGLSGATQKALADRAAGLAAQDYGNQFNRAMAQYQMDRDRDYREYSDRYARELGEYQFDRARDYGEFADAYARRAAEYQFDRTQDYAQYQDAYNRARQEFGQRYDIDRANQAGAYQNYLNELNTLGQLGNVGLAGMQDMVGRERDMANFEVQARSSLSDALAQNDFARAEAEANNILRLTGGQGELAQQAVAARNQIDQAKTQNIINQRTAAQQAINQTRASTGANISNLEAGKGQAEANYQTERGKLQGQLIGGIVDAGALTLGGAVGGMGGFGGASGLQGVMGGMNLGSELANFGAGQTFSPQAMNFARGGGYQAPQVVQATQAPVGNYGGGSMGLGAVNYGLSNYLSQFGAGTAGGLFNATRF